MAGSYPDPPEQRVPYHLDGTQGQYENYNDGNNWTTLSQAQIDRINTEDASLTSQDVANLADNGMLVLVFPRLLDIDGIFVNFGNDYDHIEWSANTTNGIDGTWATVAGVTEGATSRDSMRTAINAVALTGVKGLRAVAGTTGNFHYVKHLHIYGTPTAGEPGQLRLWHPTLDQALDPIDVGDILQGASNDLTFRVKNDTLFDATGIVLSMGTQRDETPSFLDDFTFSDGGAFSAPLNIGDLTAGSISGVITLRQQVDPTATVGPRWAYIEMTPTTP